MYIYYIYCTCIKTFACIRMWHFYCRYTIRLVCHTATETFKENRICCNNMYTCGEQICFKTYSPTIIHTETLVVLATARLGMAALEWTVKN